MAVAYKGAPTATSSDASSGTIATGNYAATVGSLLVAFVCNGSSDGSSQTVSGVAYNGQAFTRLTNACNRATNDGCIDCWYLLDNQQTTSAAITATFSANTEYRRIMVMEFTGVATSSAADVATNKGYATADPMTTTAGSPAEEGEVLVAGFSMWNYSASFTYGGSPASWTKVFGAADYTAGYYLSASTASHQCSVNIASAIYNVNSMASFKAAAAAGITISVSDTLSTSESLD
jgi:hypothetical protein